MLDFRPKHIEDYLVDLHIGQWFGWSDSKNKVYANLVIHDATKTKPTEQECIDGLAQMQAEYDAKQYQRDRASAYPSIQEQLDMLWHSVNNGTDLKASDWFNQLKSVKDTYEKPAA